MFTLAKQSGTAVPLLFFMVLSSDHITAAIGLSPTVTISKNGGSFATPTGAVSEIANGWYQVAGNATDTNTFGPIALHATAATADPSDCVPAMVVGFDPSVANLAANVIQIAGTASAGTAGYVGIDWSAINAPTTAVNLSNTSINNVNNLAVGSDSIATIATSGSTLTTGSSISGSYASTAALDGTYWQIADSAGTLDMYFEFNVGANGVPTTATWTGGVTTAADTLKVFAYNWGSSSWDQVGTVVGAASLVSGTKEFNYTTSHVGTGGNLGLVRLRFQNTGLLTCNFYTDQVLCGYASIITLAQIATNVWQDATSGDFNVSGSIGKSLFTTGTTPGASGGLLIAGNNAATTFATLTSTGAFTINGTSNVAQTGDSYARIGSTGSGLTSLAPASTALSTGTWTGARAVYLDNLSAGAVALASGVTVTTNNDKTGYSLTQAFPSNFSAMVISAGGRVSILQNAQKNTALANYEFNMTSSVAPYGPGIGLTVTGMVSLDGGAFQALTNGITEISDGAYKVSLAAGDLNANVANLQFTAPGGFQTNNTIITTP